jgi:hypothetical protein
VTIVAEVGQLSRFARARQFTSCRVPFLGNLSYLPPATGEAVRSGLAGSPNCGVSMATFG